MRFDVFSHPRGMDLFFAGGMMAQAQATFKANAIHGPDGAALKIAAAGGADIVQHMFGAVRAIGAFIRTHPRLITLRRQIFIAEFAIGA